MSHIIAITFDDPHEAERVRHSLSEVEHQGRLNLDDSAVAVKDAHGRLHVHNEVDRGIKVGALGGGAVLDPDNRAAVKMQGTVIWLTADVPTIVARMERDGASVSDRPPLLGEDRLDETARVLSERAPLYRAAADFTVDTTGKTVDDIVAEIAGLLSGFHPGA